MSSQTRTTQKQGAEEQELGTELVGVTPLGQMVGPIDPIWGAVVVSADHQSLYTVDATHTDHQLQTTVRNYDTASGQLRSRFSSARDFTDKTIGTNMTTVMLAADNRSLFILHELTLPRTSSYIDPNGAPATAATRNRIARDGSDLLVLLELLDVVHGKPLSWLTLPTLSDSASGAQLFGDSVDTELYVFSQTADLRDRIAVVRYANDSLQVAREGVDGQAGKHIPRSLLPSPSPVRLDARRQMMTRVGPAVEIAFIDTARLTADTTLTVPHDVVSARPVERLTLLPKDSDLVVVVTPSEGTVRTVNLAARSYSSATPVIAKPRTGAQAGVPQDAARGDVVITSTGTELYLTDAVNRNGVVVVQLPEGSVARQLLPNVPCGAIAVDESSQTLFALEGRNRLHMTPMAGGQDIVVPLPGERFSLVR